MSKRLITFFILISSFLISADVYTWVSNDNGETMEISFYHPDHDISGFQLEFDDCA